MLPKRSRKLQTWKGALAGRQDDAETIAELLRREHGGSHRAVKQIISMTDASERTVKHWMAGQHGPDTVFFLRLLTPPGDVGARGNGRSTRGAQTCCCAGSSLVS